MHARYLGEAFDNRDRAPVAETVFAREILRERLAGVDPAADEDRIEAHPRRTQHVGLQPVADRQHLGPAADRRRGAARDGRSPRCGLPYQVTRPPSSS